MHIEINLRNQQKLQSLVELLRSLDFVESVLIKPDFDDNKATTGSSALFDQFYGQAKSGKTIEQINHQLDKIRDEWTRDF